MQNNKNTANKFVIFGWLKLYEWGKMSCSYFKVCKYIIFIKWPSIFIKKTLIIVYKLFRNLKYWYIISNFFQVDRASGKLRNFIIEPFVPHKQVCFKFSFRFVQFIYFYSKKNFLMCHLPFFLILIYQKLQLML